MALSANTDYSLSGGDILRLPLKASEAPHQGSALGRDSSGYVRKLVAGDPFVGFCRQQIEDAPAANGDKYAEAKAGVFVGRVPLSGVAIADAATHAKVYMSDDGTFTKTSTDNSLVGTIIGVVSTGIALVRFVTNDVAGVSI